MIQISFEPAYDPYHAMFRAARLMKALPSGDIEYDKLRILDFYLCFPDLIDQFRLRPSDRRFQKLARNQRRVYGAKPDGRLTFGRMQAPQTTAAQTLARAGYWDAAALVLGWVRVLKSLPSQLSERVDRVNKEESTLGSRLITPTRRPLPRGRLMRQN